jgi:hypothetical protein
MLFLLKNVLGSFRCKEKKERNKRLTTAHLTFDKYLNPEGFMLFPIFLFMWWTG